MSKKEALNKLKDEITDIRETFNKASCVEWCLLEGYFLSNNPDKNFLNAHYKHCRELLCVVDDYFNQIQQMFENLYKAGEME